MMKTDHHIPHVGFKTAVFLVIVLYLVIFAIVTYFFYALILAHPSLGYDWKSFFYPGTRAGLSGENIYKVRGFYLFPWGAWGLAPFAPLGESLGYAVFAATSLLIIGHILVLQAPHKSAAPLVLLFGIANHQTLDMFAKGQMVEVLFTVTGLAVAQWSLKKDYPWTLGLALTLLTAKAPNGILAAAYFFFMAVFVDHQRLLKILLIPVLVAVFSLVVFGLWPLDLAESLKLTPPGETVKATIFSFLSVQQIPPLPGWGLVVAIAFISILAYRKAKDEERLIIVLATTYALTPYVQNHGLVVLWVFVAPWIAFQGKQMYWAFIALWIGTVGIMAWRLTGAEPFMSLGWLTALLFWTVVIFCVALPQKVTRAPFSAVHAK